jgi:hypothetical protein
MAISYNTSVVRDGLVLYLDAANPKSYPGNGNTWFDIKNTNNGTLINGVFFDNSNNGSFSFDGVDDYINTSYNIISGTDSSNPISIDFFIKPDLVQPATSFSPLIIGSAYYSGFGLQQTAGLYRNWIRLSTGSVSHNINLTTGIFNHIVLIWGGESDSKIYTYLNGILVAQNNITYGAFGQNHNSRPFRIGFPYTTGGNTATGYFKGNIGNIKVYNKVLTAAEVNQNFEALRGRYDI